MQIDFMRFEEIDEVVKLENECFSEPWSRDSIVNSFVMEYSKFIVAKDKSNILGYGGLYLNGDIINIAVSNSCRKMGVGTMLLLKIIEIAKCEKIETITLEVRITNIPAIKLYEKHGFKRVSLRKKYYKNGEDALIFMLEVT